MPIPQTIDGPAYIAMKSKGTGDWLDTGVYQTAGLLLPYQAKPGSDEHDKEGPPGPPDFERDKTSGAPKNDVFYYAPVREIKSHVDREYGGINSSGGPQVSGRCDHSDFFVEKNCDKSSAVLFEHCCSGEQLAWVHLAILQDGRTLSAVYDPPNSTDPNHQEYPEWNEPDRMLLHVRLKDVNITSYELSGVRYFGTETDGNVRRPKFLGVGHVERFTLLYTTISVDFGGVQRGWDTGTNEKWKSWT